MAHAVVQVLNEKRYSIYSEEIGDLFQRKHQEYGNNKKAIREKTKRGEKISREENGMEKMRKMNIEIINEIVSVMKGQKVSEIYRIVDDAPKAREKENKRVSNVTSANNAFLNKIGWEFLWFDFD